jgi:hypothetical protein
MGTTDLNDPSLRERLAEAAYYRDRTDDVVREQEHNDDPTVVFMTIAWRNLSSERQRPYRTTVETCLDWVRENVTI